MKRVLDDVIRDGEKMKLQLTCFFFQKELGEKPHL